MGKFSIGQSVCEVVQVKYFQEMSTFGKLLMAITLLTTNLNFDR